MPNSARLSIAISILTACAYAQSDRVTYQRDINGRMSPVGEVRTTADGHAERTIIIDGHPMPQEQSDEKIVRQDATGKTIERTVKTYGPTGQLVATDRVLIEQTDRPDGSTVKQTTFRLDINGRSQEFERRVTDTKTQGQSSSVETTVQHSNASGTFTTTERRTKATSGPADNQQTTETLYRAGGSGDLREAQRTVATTVTKGSQTTSNSANYEINPNGNGALIMREQTIAVSTRQANGGEVVETSVYGPVLGKSDASSAAPTLRESQRVERQVGQDGSVTEHTTVRRADLSNPGRLGPEQALSEAVCKGKCLPDPEKPKDVAKATATDAKAATPKAVDPKAVPPAAPNVKR